MQGFKEPFKPVAASGFSRAITATMVTSNGSIYASGDQVGALMNLSPLALEPNALCWLQSITVIDKSIQSAELNLLFFNSAITVPADNAAANYSDADMLTCETVETILASDYKTTTLNSVASKSTQRHIKASANGTMWMAVIVRGTPTYTSTSDLVIKLGFALDVVT